MSESTEIANAIYYLASTIKGAVCFMGYVAIIIWGASILRGKRNEPQEDYQNDH